MRGCPGAVVVDLYGREPEGLRSRLLAYCQAGLLVVAVDNNAPGSPWTAAAESGDRFLWLENRNRGGRAGGLNRRVARAVCEGCFVITLLDQDSAPQADGVLQLQRPARVSDQIVLGPSIWDRERRRWYTQELRPRLLITSGTSFSAAAWERDDPDQDWMEIDFIDHEWCSRARQRGLTLMVEPQVRLEQQFAERQPNPLVHRLGLQGYSPYRRAVARRNRRWLVLQGHVPLNIRLKEGVKMLRKPWCRLALEPNRRRTWLSLRACLQTPLGRPFPYDLLEGRR